MGSAQVRFGPRALAGFVDGFEGVRPSSRTQTVPTAKKGLAFGSKRSVCMDIPAARSAAPQTLSPGERADPGLASVRGLDWLGPNRRREGCIHVHQTYR